MNREKSGIADKLCEIGNTYINESRYQEAVQILKAVAEIEPDCAEA